MTLGAPLFLAALALLVPVLLAFLVKQRRHVLEVPSTMVWRLRARSVSRSRKLKDLRRLVALLACLVAVAALVLAAARPAGKRDELHVYVVDVSASMAAGSLAAAQRWLARDVATLGPNARVAIVVAGAEARVALPPTAPGPRVDRAIDALRPEPASAAYDEAFALASALASAGGTVVALADHPLDGDGLAGHAVQRVFARPTAADNLGITSLYTHAAPDAKDEGEREAVITVATSSAVARSARLQVSLAGRRLADRRIELDAHGEATERVALRGSGRVVARVSPDDRRADALGVDDEAALDEPARHAPRVALLRRHDDQAGAGGFFVEKALRASGVASLVELEATESVPSTLDADVLVSVAADAPTGRVPLFAIGTPPAALALSLRPVPPDQTRLRSLASDEPLLRGVALDGIAVLRAVVATPPAGARSLLELDAGPTLLASGKGKDAWIWLGIDPDASDLVLRVAFPVLVGNVLAELSGGTQVVTTKTVPRSEVTLAEIATHAPLPTAAEPRWRVPLRPAALLALVSALLLAFEAWFTFRRRRGAEVSP